MSYYTDRLYRRVEEYYEAREVGDPASKAKLDRLFEDFGHAEVHSACRTYSALRRSALRMLNGN